MSLGSFAIISEIKIHVEIKIKMVYS
jgi:hypothetical protein